ncbi:hypothetical protein [Burkholderia cepacia]|uniref:hypothetical protein n=1 Tax=Burkholderia cepacia TaxID=292 RepID=UPI001CF3B61D|nr:hypothetical protein [Burkholderia cepacia]MCA8349178.1 hypothetical protein [Burkholderia cepacia]
MSNEKHVLENTIHNASVGLADSVMLAALFSIQVKDAQDKDGATQRLRTWIHGAFDSIHADPAIPDNVKDAIKRRVDHVFDNVSKLRVN